MQTVFVRKTLQAN